MKNHVVDAGNGAGGFFANNVLAPLGREYQWRSVSRPGGPDHQ